MDEIKLYGMVNYIYITLNDINIHVLIYKLGCRDPLDLEIVLAWNVLRT